VTEVLRTTNLAVGYPLRARGGGAHTVLQGLDLVAEAGQLTCLLGPNGSGKSTLLRTLAGMQAPLAGHAELCGDRVGSLPARERARRLAVVLTGAVDVGILRVTDLVALGRHPHTGWDGRLRAVDREAVRWAIASVGASALAERDVSTLSDGERQRVMIARALAQQPRLLALDEPTAFVDVPRRMELTALLRDLARECTLGVLMTTHDLELALRTADVLWLIEPLADGGRRLHVGAPEDLALSGAVERAFASDGVRFDLDRGGFVPRLEPLGRVRVDGEGVEALWAARVVEREGLVVDAAAENLVVTALGGGRWRVAAAGTATEHGSLGEVAVRVRELLPMVAEATITT
jgi:iron complex transport system ATP-binding protein